MFRTSYASILNSISSQPVAAPPPPHDDNYETMSEADVTVGDEIISSAAAVSHIASLMPELTYSPLTHSSASSSSSSLNSMVTNSLIHSPSFPSSPWLLKSEQKVEAKAVVVAEKFFPTIDISSLTNMPEEAVMAKEKKRRRKAPTPKSLAEYDKIYKALQAENDIFRDFIKGLSTMVENNKTHIEYMHGQLDLKDKAIEKLQEEAVRAKKRKRKHTETETETEKVKSEKSIPAKKSRLASKVILFQPAPDAEPEIIPKQEKGISLKPD